MSPEIRFMCSRDLSLNDKQNRVNRETQNKEQPKKSSQNGWLAPIGISIALVIRWLSERWLRFLQKQPTEILIKLCNELEDIPFTRLVHNWGNAKWWVLLTSSSFAINQPIFLRACMHIYTKPDKKRKVYSISQQLQGFYYEDNNLNSLYSPQSLPVDMPRDWAYLADAGRQA